MLWGRGQEPLLDSCRVHPTRSCKLPALPVWEAPPLAPGLEGRTRLRTTALAAEVASAGSAPQESPQSFWRGQWGHRAASAFQMQCVSHLLCLSSLGHELVLNDLSCFSVRDLYVDFLPRLLGNFLKWPQRSGCAYSSPSGVTCRVFMSCQSLSK